MARILQSPETLRLDRERIDLPPACAAGEIHTREMIRLEAEMATGRSGCPAIVARRPREDARDDVRAS
jgi:hypothetical protein